MDADRKELRERLMTAVMGGIRDYHHCHPGQLNPNHTMSLAKRIVGQLMCNRLGEFLRGEIAAPTFNEPTLDSVCRELEAEWPESEPVYHRGWEFHGPFVCGRCGVSIPSYQFAFARACGACDLGDRRARFGVFDKRWFLGGPAEMVNPDDRCLIHPEFIPAADCDKYPRLKREKPNPRHTLNTLGSNP